VVVRGRVWYKIFCVVVCVMVWRGRFLSKVVMSHTNESHQICMSHVPHKGFVSHITAVYGSAWPCVVKDLLCGSVWLCVAEDSSVK